MPKTLTKGKHLELQRAYTSAHHHLEDDERPAPCYMEWSLEQVEDGELLAEQLDIVISKEEATEDNLGGAQILPNGGVRVQK